MPSTRKPKTLDFTAETRSLHLAAALEPLTAQVKPSTFARRFGVNWCRRAAAFGMEG